MIVRDRVQDRIEKRLRRRKYLSLHAGLTILIALAVVWAVDVFNFPSKTQDIIIPAAVLLLIAHVLWNRYQEAAYTIIQQETERERYTEPYEKPKHHLAVSDDGELTEVSYDEDDWDEKPKHNS